MSKELASGALSKALNSASTMNYEAIFNGFSSMGIPMADILPRENVFTFKAWEELGRVVKKGEHGVSVLTWVPVTKKIEGAEDVEFATPRKTTVFHISQTIEIEGAR
jgi:antirestriction protein ArdC